MDSQASGSDRRRLLQRHWTEQLYKEYENLCFQYHLSLRQPLLRVEDLPGRWGLWDPVARTITLSIGLIQNYSWDVVVEILKHEVAHQVVAEVYAQDELHGPNFRMACQTLAVSPWASRAEADLEHPITPWHQQALTGQEERLLKKAEKLFALATSSNEHEAQLAMEKAQALYAKHHLDKLQEKKQAGLVHLVMPIKRKRIERYESLIGSILVDHFSVQLVYTQLYDAQDSCAYQAIEIMGTPENVTLAEYVYHFLWNKVHQLWEDYRQRLRPQGRCKHSYLLGVLAGFNEKLEERRRNTPTRTTGLPARDDESCQRLIRRENRRLKDFMNQRYPRLSGKSWQGGLRERGAYSAGVQEGQKLTLSRAIGRQPGSRGKQLTS